MPLRSRRLPAFLATAALVLLAPLVVWNLWPDLFPQRADDQLAALPLALIAVTYLVYQRSRGANWKQMAQAAMLATGFLLWSATQFWPDLPRGLLLNDIAIVLFVSELFLVVGTPAAQVGGGV